MSTIYGIKQRAQQLSEKTDAESISPAEVGGLFSDLADYANDVDVNGSSLGIRKTYTSVSAMEADKSPVGDDGKPLKKGQLVNIYNQDDPSSADINKVFSWQNPGWQIRTTLDAGYATREELTELENKTINNWKVSLYQQLTELSGLRITNYVQGTVMAANTTLDSYIIPVLPNTQYRFIGFVPNYGNDGVSCYSDYPVINTEKNHIGRAVKKGDYYETVSGTKFIVVTVKKEDVSENNRIISETIDLIDKKLSISDLKSERGDSENTAMTQEAVSRELKLIEGDILDLVSNVEINKLNKYSNLRVSNNNTGYVSYSNDTKNSYIIPALPNQSYYFKGIIEHSTNPVEDKVICYSDYPVVNTENYFIGKALLKNDGGYLTLESTKYIVVTIDTTSNEQNDDYCLNWYGYFLEKLIKSVYTDELLKIEKTLSGKYITPTGSIGNDNNYDIDIYSVDYYCKDYKLSGKSFGSIATAASYEDLELINLVDTYKIHYGVEEYEVDESIYLSKAAKYIAITREKTKIENPTKLYKKYAKNKIEEITDADSSILPLKDKKVLVIADSIGAANKWQKSFSDVTGAVIRNHVKGGIGIIQMVDGDGSGDAPEGYDPDDFGTSTIYKLNKEDVSDVEVILLCGFYNERNTESGNVNDMYPTNNTFCGRLNYAVKRIHEEMNNASNHTARLIIVSAHKYGKYPYLDITAYQDGDKLYNNTKSVADYNSIPCIDLMHELGINEFNWNIFQSSNTPYNPNYIPNGNGGVNDGENRPFESLEKAPSAADNTGKYITINGESNCYQSDGENWVKKSIPFIMWADQLHLGDLGYNLYGRYVANKTVQLLR